MLHRDYLVEMIRDFVNMVMMALGRALKDHDKQSAEEAEAAVAELIDLDPEFALELAPDSLVTMMLLSGVADSIAQYVTYTLSTLSVAYDEMGEERLAGLRKAQAEAVAESFGCDINAVPEGMEGLI